MNNNIKARELRINKTLDAPVQLVWDVWTKPGLLAKWWGPEGFTTTIIKMNVQAGEEWLLTLHASDGKRYPNKSVFMEVIPFRKLMYEHFNPGFIATVVFTPAANNKTNIEWALLFETVELFDTVVKTFKADEGQKQNIAKLQRLLLEISAGQA